MGLPENAWARIFAVTRQYATNAFKGRIVCAMKASFQCLASVPSAFIVSILFFKDPSKGARRRRHSGYHATKGGTTQGLLYIRKTLVSQQRSHATPPSLTTCSLHPIMLRTIRQSDHLRVASDRSVNRLRQLPILPARLQASTFGV